MNISHGAGWTQSHFTIECFRFIPAVCLLLVVFSPNLRFKLFPKLQIIPPPPSVQVIHAKSRKADFYYRQKLQDHLKKSVLNIHSEKLKLFVIMVGKKSPCRKGRFIWRMLMCWKQRFGAQESLRISALTH